jgi:hypothetical protein
MLPSSFPRWGRIGRYHRQRSAQFTAPRMVQKEGRRDLYVLQGPAISEFRRKSMGYDGRQRTTQ